MAKILVLCGHPRAGSFSEALASAYAEAAKQAGHTVTEVALSTLPVGLEVPDYGDFKRQGTAPDWVLTLQAQIAACDHWVTVTPMWWGGVPAKLKALFDAVLLPGFAFRYRTDSPWWDKLLAGRSARVIVTADTPGFFFRWVYGKPLLRQLKGQILGFCGFAPVRFSYLAPLRSSTPDQRQAWLQTAAALGRAGA